MAQVAQSAAALRIRGEDLVPEEITKLLGAEPTSSQRKGERIVGRKTGSVRIAKGGIWRISAADREPADIDAQIEELLSRVSSDLEVWRGLAGRYRIDLFCGLFMNESNEGLVISARSLAALGERGIAIGFDIYGGRD